MFPGVCIAIPHRRDNGIQFSMRRFSLMEPRNLSYMTQAANGERLSGAHEDLVQRVCTDSRQVQPGDLFIALRGDRFDGHAYLAEVARKGAVAAVVEVRAMPAQLPGCGLIVVENTRAAFGTM